MSVLALPIPLEARSIRDLETELLSLAAHITAALCQFLKVLAEFDDRNGWAGPGIRSCAHWLSWRAGMSLRTATDHLRVAHALPRLPRITEAFAAGRISYSKVRALTRVTGTDTAALTRIAAAIAAGDPDLRHLTVADPETAEQVLLNLALSGTASHVETVVAAVRRQPHPTRRHRGPAGRVLALGRRRVAGPAGPVHSRRRCRPDRRDRGTDDAPRRDHP
ncbi:DUF222 domain-containing protein [Pseudonocardia kunmingensis]|uniref:Uncharacterized protein DUF222 n=1 Tax=Pseudonocardia kunmingensis TaxID=630975 RepID=A0A543DLB1_9PSEU|nr:DUF222 domain-containing protein [Pseudonocardia kunmingensis]TQM10093.1 uncharacterized protein DUF222 [Pseudonocardia kunmingensis]